LRDALLDAGIEQLGTHGYAATGVAAIAAAASAPKGSFYTHFHSKEAIAIEALARYGQGRRLELLIEPGVPALERIRKHLTHLRNDLAAYEFRRGCMIGNFAAESPAGAPGLITVITSAFTQWRTALIEAIRDGQDNGEIDSRIDAVATAALIIDAWEGAAIRAKALGDPDPVDNVVHSVFDRLLSVP
jgi:TetR/AcrR family transcriptional repressor of nem operon